MRSHSASNSAAGRASGRSSARSASRSPYGRIVPAGPYRPAARPAGCPGRPAAPAVRTPPHRPPPAVPAPRRRSGSAGRRPARGARRRLGHGERIAATATASAAGPGPRPATGHPGGGIIERSAAGAGGRPRHRPRRPASSSPTGPSSSAAPAATIMSQPAGSSTGWITRCGSPPSVTTRLSTATPGGEPAQHPEPQRRRRDASAPGRRRRRTLRVPVLEVAQVGPGPDRGHRRVVGDGRAPSTAADHASPVAGASGDRAPRRRAGPR